MFPLALLSVDFLKYRKFTIRIFLENLPLLAISLAIGVWTISAQKAGGAVDDPSRYSILAKVLFANYGLAAYISKLFAPINLSHCFHSLYRKIA